MSDSCATCRFWRSYDSANGQCHRYAPKPELLNTEWKGYWPDTYDHDWCGEHEPKREQAADDRSPDVARY